MDKLRWGMIAVSGIANTFVRGIKDLADAEIVAVGSRNIEKARAFSQTHGIARAYGSYEELVNDPAVDAVYVSTPHVHHLECVLLCLKAGKPVLCEKPFAMNEREAVEAIKVARELKIFLMEAMWTRFLPVYSQVHQWIAEGAIGELMHVRASFGFSGNFDPKGRLFDRELGGGALLDVGVYPVSFLSHFMGLDFDEMESTAYLGETGVDEMFTAVLKYPGSKTAAIQGAIRADMMNDGWLCGTKGKIHLPDFWKGRTATLHAHGREPLTVACPYAEGFSFEAAEVMSCIRQGLTESARMPLDETRRIARTLDALRSRWGLVYSADLAQEKE